MNRKKRLLISFGLAVAGMFLRQEAAAAAQLPVNLGNAGDYVILSKSGISTVPPSAVTGDMGVSPITSTGITGFSLTISSSGTYATSAQVTGKVYAPDYAAPTPAHLTSAIGDMQTAYTDAAGRVTPDFTELGAGEIGGLTLVPGLYKWGTGVMITTDVTLNGGPNDIWIFQIAGSLNEANGKHVILSGGAQAKNIFWQSFGVVSIGTGSHFEGIIMAKTGITLGTQASINGRLLAQTAVTLNANTVTSPANSVPAGFFTGQVSVGNGVDYLQFPNGNIFGYYNVDNFPFPTFYHFDMGYEYFFDAHNAAHGAYLYDFASSTFFYTDPTLFPYLYDFTLNAWLYYFPDMQHPGRYTSHPRSFYNFSTGQIINK